MLQSPARNHKKFYVISFSVASSAAGFQATAISLRTRKASAAKHRTKKMRSIFEESSPFATITS
ncbi:hypothetical protein AAV98_09785 [Bacillus sp. CHD6a]|nr:hypothetical protein AAV98_09785 [Bacillus sp. CHD6a]